MTNSSSEPARPGEFELIAKYFAPLAAGSAGAFGLRDDAAFLRVPDGHELVLTADAIVENVHFISGDPPDLIAAKALRVNLSDLAAKGAIPVGYLMTLCLPPHIAETWISRFADGLARDQQQFGIGLLGGDTTATTGPVVVSITALGIVPPGQALHRHGAQPGDLVFVTGSVGDAGAGLAVLQGAAPELPDDAAAALVSRYRLPQPRLTVGPGLRGIATAALDVSDGLIADLGHIARVSGVRIAAEASRLPLSPGFIRLYGDNLPARAKAATAGDDYEIAFTAPASARAALARIAAASGVQITEIGRVESGAGAVLTGPGGQPIPLARPGYVHF